MEQCGLWRKLLVEAALIAGEEFASFFVDW